MGDKRTEEKGGTSRRGFIVGGAGLAAGLTLLGPSDAYGYEPLPPIGSWPWPAGGIDPVATAGGSTDGLRGCAMTSFGLILAKLKELLPEDSIWQAIPPGLASAFNGGGPYGSDCGALQGPLLMMTLVGAPATLKLELYRWYCGFPFPSREWDHLYAVEDTIQTVSGSPLCHESRTIWEGAFIREVYPLTGVYDETRCSKLTRDCVKKTVELINELKLTGYAGVWEPDAGYVACYDCHTELNANRQPGGISSGKEDCTRCHDVPSSHGVSSPRRGRR